MPGFLITNQNHKNISDKSISSTKYSRIICENYIIEQITLDKFSRDEVIFENKNIVCVTSGVLFNKQDLFVKYKCETIPDLVFNIFNKNNYLGFIELRGPFSGALYIKKDKKWIIFTNHIGDSAIFYYRNETEFAISSHVNYILEAFNGRKGLFEFNESAAYQMLTFGFMADGSTYAKQIMRLQAGHYIEFKHGNFHIGKYFSFSKNIDHFKNADDEYIINELDAAFQTAIYREFSKDQEYGYRHLVDISGGLDSRMTLWVAHHLGYEDILLLNYGKADYLDETIAKSISSYLKKELLIRPLDDANYLYDIDECVFMNGGLALYSGITGGNRFLKNIRTDLFGIEHTGMLGDVVLGSYLKDDSKIQHYSGKYSEKLSARLPDNFSEYYKNFDDYEMYLLYTRGFHGITSTHFIRRNYIETHSPFLDVDFFSVCMDIPLKKRANHYIYKKWILSKYPDAARFKWEKTNSTLSNRFSIINRYLLKGPQKLLKIIGKDNIAKNNMNPLDFWFANDKALKIYINNYKNDCSAIVKAYFSEKLFADLDFLFNTGNFWEKSMVLTVLSASKLYMSFSK